MQAPRILVSAVFGAKPLAAGEADPDREDGEQRHRAVERGEINFYLVIFHFEKLPFRMFDLVFVAARKPSFRVTPIMFDDKFAV